MVHEIASMDIAPCRTQEAREWLSGVRNRWRFIAGVILIVFSVMNCAMEVAPRPIPPSAMDEVIFILHDLRWGASSAEVTRAFGSPEKLRFDRGAYALYMSVDTDQRVKGLWRAELIWASTPAGNSLRSLEQQARGKLGEPFLVYDPKVYWIIDDPQPSLVSLHTSTGAILAVWTESLGGHFIVSTVKFARRTQ